MRRLERGRVIRRLAICVALVVSPLTNARAGSPGQSPTAAVDRRPEIARGAAAVAALTARRYAYATTYRMIGALLKKDLARAPESDAFLLGVHLAAAFWVDRLPQDLSWRDDALARHRHLVEWLMPRSGLPVDEVARIVARAQPLTPASEQRLVEFLRRICRKAGQ